MLGQVLAVAYPDCCDHDVGTVRFHAQLVSNAAASGGRSS